VGDTWLGVVLLVVLSIGMLVAILAGTGRDYLDGFSVILLEMIYVLPVVLIFVWRRIHPRHLGFGKFTLNVMGIGCGLLAAGYVIILAHNMLLYALGVDTQGDQIFKLLEQLESPVWFFVTGAVVAPVVEEIFFRGFLLQGFRQKYGWVVAILLSSFLFAAAHLDPVSFIPTFVLGCVLAFVYHHSNSLWPPIIFHAAINSFSLLAVYVMSQYPGLIPT
jgi:membrane protease YdiL (CAAX protease family)